MKKKMTGIFECMLLIAATVLLPTATSEINQKSAIDFTLKSLLNPRPSYFPEDIDLKDATYHKSYGRYHVEWWYFEGIFENGYSIVAYVTICSKKSQGFCMLAMEVYKDAKLKINLRKVYLLKEFEASDDFPFIKVSGKQIIKFDRERYNSTGERIYNVTFQINGQSAILQFTGTTNGWKGNILRGCYGPVLPKANVEGMLILNGKQINVSGLGYHEHAWQIPLLIWEWGWYWGKIVSDSFTLFWGKMMNTRWNEQTRVGILTQDQGSYINIDPKNIKIKATNYRYHNRRFIPTKFIINVSDKENSIYVNATIETVYIHQLWLGTPFYWRYHLRINGNISYGTTIEEIKDKIQVLEVVRFR